MASRQSKIEALGLDATVQRYMAEGIVTRAAMTEKLTADHGADVSEATVGRYMAKIRAAASSKAFQTISDHVDKTVPEDLAALEEMEKQSLDWSREAGKDRVERVARATEDISGEIDVWVDRFLSVSEKPEDREKLVRWIIKKCLSYLSLDDRRQDKRLDAMRMVHKIVETKLSKAGLLDDDTRGRIVFLKRDDTRAQSSTPGVSANDTRPLRMVINRDRSGSDTD